MTSDSPAVDQSSLTRSKLDWVLAGAGLLAAPPYAVHASYVPALLASWSEQSFFVLAGWMLPLLLFFSASSFTLVRLLRDGLTPRLRLTWMVLVLATFAAWPVAFKAIGSALGPTGQ